ncbi:MAG: GTP-binding protein [Acidobacteria bacterium]|nr:GTP-binding protein [Acidobacteriota bacterium]
MKVYDAAHIRNVALVGHSGCGKTQLASAMLFAAGAATRLGLVDDGSTITDFDEEAIARKHTLAASLAHAEWRQTKINIVDTPGVANFLTEARSALRVVECALVVVDAVAGVEVQTEKLWAEAAALGLPRIVVVNRLDRDRASTERTLESLRRSCAREIAPIQIPIGAEGDWTGIVDLLRMKALTFLADGSGAMTEIEIPEDLVAGATEAREQLVEMVAEGDERLMEIYFADGTLTQEQLVEGLRAGTVAGRLYPMAYTSGLRVIGVQPLLDVIVDHVPSPAERDVPGVSNDGDGTGEATTVKATDDAPPIALAWKTVADPFAGRITMLRAVSGTLASDTTTHNLTRDSSERLGHLLVLQGKTQTQVAALKAGDLGAAANPHR